MISERNDAFLVQAALRGEDDAYGELARRYRKAAFGAAYNRLGDYDAAVDAAQEALVAAYIQLPMLKDPGRFAAWLCRIAGNMALMRLRQHRPTLSLDSPQTTRLMADAGQSEKNDALREALARLSETDRSAVVLHYVSGYSHEEIAGILGVSASSVKTRLYRARRQLREEMLEEMETVGNQLPDVEVTEDLLENMLVKHDAGEHGIIVHLGGVPGALPGMPQYTEKTKEAIRRIADRLRKEGCSRLYAPPHIPDGSPALPIFRSLGFETETQACWYERDLTTRLSVAPPLGSGYEVRKLKDANPTEILVLLRNTSQKHAPDAIDEQYVQGILQDPHIVHDASLAAYQGERLAAVVSAFAVTSWETWKYEPGTGILWWTDWDETTAPPSAVTHLISLSLKALKRRGLKRAVKDMLHPDHNQALITVLETLNFRNIRSQWNLRLPLQDG